MKSPTDNSKELDELNIVALASVNGGVKASYWYDPATGEIVTVGCTERPPKGGVLVE